MIIFASMRSTEETYLLAALAKGEPSAFDSIFRRYYPVLCAYGSRLVGLEDAKEIAEETMIWLWEHRDSHVINSSLSSYLLKCVYRRALNQIKRNEIKGMADTRFFNKMQEMMEDADFYQFQELSRRIKEAVDALPESYREVFIMHRFQEKTYREIAEQLNIPTKTVDYRMQQALKQLRKDLRDYLPLLIFILTKCMASGH